MKVTAATKAKIQVAMAKKGWNQTRLAKAIGSDRSKISRLLSDDKAPEFLKAEVIDALNDALEIDLFPMISQDSPSIPHPAAHALGVDAMHDTELGDALDALLRLLSRPDPPHIPNFHQKDLTKLGATVTRIVAQWENGKDPHYAKIGAETLNAIREMLPKLRN